MRARLRNGSRIAVKFAKFPSNLTLLRVRITQIKLISVVLHNFMLFAVEFPDTHTHILSDTWGAGVGATESCAKQTTI